MIGVIDMTTEYLIDKELEHVYAALMPENRLVCKVCAHTGLRVSDVLALKPGQLSRQFWVTEAKTGKRRRVNLTNELLGQLQAQAGKYWVFPGARDPKKHRTRQAVWADVKRASKAFRLPQNVGVHSLRKVYAVDKLSECKGDIGKLQKVLNHSNQATTMIYAMAYQLYLAKYGDRDQAGRGHRRRK